MKKLWIGLTALLSLSSQAAVTIPYVFSPGETIQSSPVNADFSAVASEINSHEAATNPHQTTLQEILALGNSCGTYSINFNGQQALDMAVENLASDPSPGTIGRLFINTTSGLLKFDNGSTIITIAGSGVNNLSTVLNSGNSAGAFNIDVNENQLLHARVENLSSDPSSGNAGRLYFNTTSKALKLDTGSALTAIGGSQGLSSVLGISNSAGSTNINFNQVQALGMALDNEASDPSAPVNGQVYYNTSSNIPKFYNGSGWLQIGNTNTLAQVLSQGNSVGSNPINFNSQQAQNMVLFNNSGSPGTGTGGFIWYDTSVSKIGYETSSTNHYLADIDSTQTLTHKSMSGASNTFTNIPDGALSGNVDLLNGAQAITGIKTFTAYPVVNSVTSTSGANIAIPTGTSNDTFALLGATQTLQSTTLNAPTFLNNSDFMEGQALHFRVENLSADPSAGHSGRVYYKTTTGELKYDDGTNTHVLAVSSGGGNFTNAVTITGSQDLVQLSVIGNATQTNNLQNWENSGLGVLADIDHLGNMVATSFTGVGSGLTTLNASNISSGNLALARLPTAVTWPSSGTVQSVTPTNHGVVISGSGASADVTSAGASGTLLAGAGASTDPSFSSTPTLGINGTTGGTIALANATASGGSVTLQNLGTTSGNAYNFNLPTTAGGSGQVLTSQGGGSTSMTWVSPLINPMTTLGDLIYENASPAAARLAGSTSATLAVLTQTGTGTVSAAPVWTSSTGTGNVMLSASPTTTGTLTAGIVNAGTAGSTFAGNTTFNYDGSSGLNLNLNRSANTVANTLYWQTGSTYEWSLRSPTGASNFAIRDVANGVDMLTFTQGGGISTGKSLTVNGNVAIGTGGPDFFSRGYSKILGIGGSADGAIEINSTTGNNAFLDMGINSVRQFGLSVGTSNSSIGTISSTNLILVSANATAVTIDTSQKVSFSAATNLPGNATALKAPTVQKFTSSSGTYTTPTSPSPLYIKVTMVGGGGGGAGSGTSPGSTGSGGNSTFGTSLLVANGGGGASTETAGSGGSASLGSGPIGDATAGSYGSPGAQVVSNGGGSGGGSPLGGAGAGGAGTGSNGGVGIAAATNSGSGGGGAGSGSAAANSGGGGGSGGYVSATITSPSATYAYAVGSSGSGGNGGTSGNSGAAGAAGIIIVEEFYQ